MSHSLGQLANPSWLFLKAIWLLDAWPFKWPMQKWRHSDPAECLLLAHQWQQAHISYRFYFHHACFRHAATALCWVVIIVYCLYGFLPSSDVVYAVVKKSIWRAENFICID